MRERDRERTFIDGERMVDERMEYLYEVSTPKMTYNRKNYKHNDEQSL